MRSSWTVVKERILDAYMNQVHYGNLTYGFEAASRPTSRRPPRGPGVKEAALPAGFPQEPTLYDPFQPENRPKRAGTRCWRR